MLTFWRVLIINGVEFCWIFFCICWGDHMVFVLPFVNVVYHIEWFPYVEESVHPWDKSHLIMVYNSFNVLLIYVRFYHKWMLNFVQSFFCIYWDDHRAFTLQFVSVVYHSDFFCGYWKFLAPLWQILLDHDVWSFLKHYWICLTSILLRISSSAVFWSGFRWIMFSLNAW